MRGNVARFSYIAATILGRSDRMLSERLRELKSEGLVERCVYAEIPVRVEYRLTPAADAPCASDPRAHVFGIVDRWPRYHGLCGLRSR